MILKSKAFYCHTYEFDFSGDGEGGCTHQVWGFSWLMSNTNIHHW